MKSMLFSIICFFLFATTIYGQGHKIIEGVQEVKVRNIGSIKNGSLIKGYYTFYEYDKADKRNLIFKLDLLDENLNPIGSKEIEGSKKMILISSAFDGTNFCFKFWDDDANTIQMKVFNQQGQEVANNTENTKYAPTNMNNYFYQATSPELGVLDNNGFINYSFHSDDKGFFVNYVDGNSKVNWSRAYEPANKYKIMTPSFLSGNKEMILTGVSIMCKGDDGKKGGNFLLASNTKTGAVIFDISTDFGENFVAPFSANISNDKIIVTGLVYPTYNSLTATPQGFAFIELDKKGKVLNKTFKDFDQNIGKFQPLDNHKFSDGFFPFIHEIIKTNTGNTLILIEKFKGGQSVVLGNLVLLELDKNNTYVQAKEVTREAERTEGVPFNFFGSYFAAYMAKTRNNMGYQYMQANDDNSEASFSYIEHEAKATKGIYRIQYFGQLKYKDGKMTADKVEIKYGGDENADYTWLYPAKTGYVLKASYYKKKKSLAMDFVKLNN